MQELAPALPKSTYVNEPMLDQFCALYKDPHYWTSVITFIATWGTKARVLPGTRS